MDGCIHIAASVPSLLPSCWPPCGVPVWRVALRRSNCDVGLDRALITSQSWTRTPRHQASPVVAHEGLTWMGSTATVGSRGTLASPQDQSSVPSPDARTAARRRSGRSSGRPTDGGLIFSPSRCTAATAPSPSLEAVMCRSHGPPCRAGVGGVPLSSRWGAREATATAVGNDAIPYSLRPRTASLSRPARWIRARCRARTHRGVSGHTCSGGTARHGDGANEPPSSLPSVLPAAAVRTRLAPVIRMACYGGQRQGVDQPELCWHVRGG